MLEQQHVGSRAAEVTVHTLLLLPGMDGTGRLFDRFVSALSPRFDLRIARYPVDRVLEYDALLGEITLPDAPFAIVAESFSGPLGIRIAATGPKHLAALVLVASFARSPMPQIPAWLRAIAAPILFRAAPPDFALRRTLFGKDARAADLDAFRAVLRQVHPNVLAARLRAIGAVDVRSDLARSIVPALYLAGSRDRLVSPRILAELRALRPDLEEAIVDAPHFVLQERPRESAAAIEAFLDRVSERRTSSPAP